MSSADRLQPDLYIFTGSVALPSGEGTDLAVAKQAHIGAIRGNIPTTAAALLVLIPLMVEFIHESPWEPVKFCNSFALVFIGLLMVSRLPIISFKKVRVPPHWIVPTLVSVALLGASLVNAPWHTAVILGLVYIGVLPVGVWHAYRLQKQAAAAESSLRG